MNFTEKMLKEKLFIHEHELGELLAEYHALVTIAQQRGFYHALDLLWEEIQRVESAIKSVKDKLEKIEREKQGQIHIKADGIYLSGETQELMELME